MSYKYRADNYNIYFSPEYSYRVLDTGDSAGATNAADDTFYHAGIKLTRPPHFRYRPNKVVEHIAGMGPDEGYSAHHGWKLDPIILEGEVHAFDLMLFACKAVTNAGSNPYTHTYVTSTARTATVPTFRLYQRLVNDDTNESVLTNVCGCAIRNWSLSWDINTQLKARFEIIWGSMVAGTALNSYPQTKYGNKVYGGVELPAANLTYSKGGTAYKGRLKHWDLMWNDNCKNDMAGGYAGIPAGVDYGTRVIRSNIHWSPLETDDADDADNDLPTSDNDIDMQVKWERGTNDYLDIQYAKLWYSGSSDGYWENDYLMQRDHELMISTEESGAQIQIQQKDTNPGTGRMAVG